MEDVTGFYNYGNTSASGVRNALVTVGVAAGEVAPDNPKRQMIYIFNSDTNAVNGNITVSLGVAAVAGVGHYLAPGQGISYSTSEGFLCPKCSITAISDQANSTLSVVEM